MVRIAAAVGLGAVVMGATPAQSINNAVITSDGNPPLLSDFGFFIGAADQPSGALVPYALTTPLFSDYADKRRFIYLPAGTRMTAGADGVIAFPVGAAIIKSFGYGQADGGYRTIETRVLLHRASGWVALPYIWRADGSDADLRIAGGRTPVTFTDPSGQSRTISYAVPNRNQCANCHNRDGVLMPIGPQVRNIELAAPARTLVAGADWSLPHFPRWNDASSGTLDQRARAYLDSNCAHCHNPRGSASNSGLVLRYDQPAGVAIGILKRPVAAGRGSGGLDYAIAPGHPELSYMPYRMNSTDPGIAMPELGRGTVHSEGVALITQWIAAMPASAPASAPPHE